MSKEYPNARFRVHVSGISKFVAILSGIALCVFSAVYTIDLMMKISNGYEISLPLPAMWLTIGVGICLEIAKFYSLTGGFALFKNQKTKVAIPVFILAASLTLISISASLGSFNATEDHAENVARKSSDQYKALTQSIESMDASIASMRRSLDAQADIGHVTQAERTGRAIERLEAKKEVLLNKMPEAGKGEEKTAKQSMFQGIANSIPFFSPSADSIKTIYHFMFSILIEAGAVFLLWLGDFKSGIQVVIHEELSDGTDPTSRRPSLDKKEGLAKSSETPSFNQVQPHPNAVLTLVKQEEEADCGMACLAMIMGTDIKSAREIWTGDFHKKTGIDLNEFLDFIKTKNIPFNSIYNVSESLEKIAGDDNVVLCVVGINGTGINGSFDGHAVMFEKGVVYCPSRGYMSEQEAFTRFFRAHSFHLIKCADLPFMKSPFGAMADGNQVQEPIANAPDDVPEKVHQEGSKPQKNKGFDNVVSLVNGGVPAKRNQRKRNAGSADTCTSKGKNLRYREVVAKVRKGMKPTVRAIKDAMGCNQETAFRYREDMLKKGITMQLPDGTHILKPRLRRIK